MPFKRKGLTHCPKWLRGAKSVSEPILKQLDNCHLIDKERFYEELEQAKVDVRERRLKAIRDGVIVVR